MACLAKAEGGIWLDLDVWRFRHRNWQHTMRGATLIACHTGLNKYAPSMFTVCQDLEPQLDLYEPSYFDAFEHHVLGTSSQQGIVTTTFMGVTKGDPIWDNLRTELASRVIQIFRNEQHAVETGTLSYRPRFTEHAHIDLIFLTNPLNQRWIPADATFIDRPTKIGIVFGSFQNRVQAKCKGNDK